MQRRPIAPARERRKSSAVYESLRHAVLSGRHKPGEALLEVNLAAEFGCSQGTIREALLRLQEDGFVRRMGYRGTVVSATSEDEAREMLRLRLRLESQGGRRAAPGVDDAFVAELSAMVRAMEDAAAKADVPELARLDCAFHLAIFQRADLPALEPVLTRCMLHIHRLALSHPKLHGSLQRSASRHWEIVEALESRDGEAAARVLEGHVRTVPESRRILGDAHVD